MDGTTGRDDGQDIDGGTAKLLMRSRSSDRLVRVRCLAGPADGSVTRHEASHTQSQTSPSGHRTHPPEPEPGPSGPFDVTAASYALAMARDATTHDDSGTQRVPTSRSEWDQWVSASATRNHVLGDPLLDWLERHGESKGFERDPVDGRTDFLEFIFRKGIEFERAVVDHLRGLNLGEVRTLGADDSAPVSSRDLDLALETWDAMAEGVAIIDQGALRDPQSRTYGLPDLLIRSDVLAELFPEDLTAEQAAIPAPALDLGDCHYVVVDIKYTTLNLSARGKILNSGSAPAYKVQLHIYSRALGRLQEYRPPRAFLLGRSWKQTVRGTTSRGNGCMDRLGPVEHNEATPAGTLRQRADAATAWMRRMRRDGHDWAALPQPSVDELRPDVGGDPGVWASAVEQIVEASGDLTVLRGVGVDRRRQANEAGLFDWRDDRVTPAALGVKGAVAAPVLRKLLDVNRRPGPVVRPAQVETARSAWIDVPTLEFYVDFETVSDLDDDFSFIPAKGGQPLVFMVGCGHVEDDEWHFECFTADELTELAEAVVIEQWLDHMAEVVDRLDPGVRPKVFHWSAAEVSYLQTAYNAAVKRHGSRGRGWVTPTWFDFLSQVIRKEPVVVRGAHGFGLKAIANALHAAGLVETNWVTGPTDGLGAMVGAWWCQKEVAEGRASRLMDLAQMQEIRDYNEVDCKAMMEVVRYLREHH